MPKKTHRAEATIGFPPKIIELDVGVFGYWKVLKALNLNGSEGFGSF